MEALHKRLKSADAYVMYTPEYNHAPSAALLNLLSHFGSSVFGFKPSAIASYSAGQWGGTRAASALRPVLSELGCLPVSSMIHVPHAGEAFDGEGRVVDSKGDHDPDRWDGYTDRTLAQLEWWADATRAHRTIVDPMMASPPLVKTPAQRNAPRRV